MSAAEKVAEPGLYAVVRVSWSPPPEDGTGGPMSSLFVRLPRSSADSDLPSELLLWWQPEDAAGWTWDDLHDGGATVEVVRGGSSTADPEPDPARWADELTDTDDRSESE